MTIDLKNPARTLFDEEAERFAKQLCGDDRVNKPSQLRRFFDQLVQLDDYLAQKPEEYARLEPEIRMLNAHAAYAKGRKLVSDVFKSQFQTLIRAIECPRTLHNARLFFEATLGYLRAERND